MCISYLRNYLVREHFFTLPMNFWVLFTYSPAQFETVYWRKHKKKFNFVWNLHCSYHPFYITYILHVVRIYWKVTAWLYFIWGFNTASLRLFPSVHFISNTHCYFRVSIVVSVKRINFTVFAVQHLVIKSELRYS